MTAEVRHCEERSDEGFGETDRWAPLDCFGPAGLAMTAEVRHCEERSDEPPGLTRGQTYAQQEYDSNFRNAELAFAAGCVARCARGLRRPAGLLILAFAFFCAVVPGQAAGEATIEIVSRSGLHAFAVELATNDAERSRGLMFRKELAEGHGMLFDFKNEQPVAFWMRNTYIPLDMIFIRGDGRILRIAENTEPLSDRLIPSGGPVRAVLEVIAGTARKLGIAAGDRVEGAMFRGSR
jgi:uncharacterized membrane protein (UPF0127 family)